MTTLNIDLKGEEGSFPTYYEDLSAKAENLLEDRGVFMPEKDSSIIPFMDKLSIRLNLGDLPCRHLSENTYLCGNELKSIPSL